MIITAHASILLLHRRTAYYPQLESILVYPHAYEAPSERHFGDYLEVEFAAVAAYSLDFMLLREPFPLAEDLDAGTADQQIDSRFI